MTNAKCLSKLKTLSTYLYLDINILILGGKVHRYSDISYRGHHLKTWRMCVDQGPKVIYFK